MKRVILLLTAVLLLGASAQAASPKYIRFNYAGTDGLGGFSFDSRFKDGSRFGYNVGLAYGFEYFNSSYNLDYLDFSTVKVVCSPISPSRLNNGYYNTFMAPLSVYYLVGKKNHFFEPSLGVTLYATDYDFSNSNARVGYFAFAKFAYRFEAKTIPLMVSGGLNVNFNTPESGLYKPISVGTFLSVGYRL